VAHDSGVLLLQTRGVNVASLSSVSFGRAALGSRHGDAGTAQYNRSSLCLRPCVRARAWVCGRLEVSPSCCLFWSQVRAVLFRPSRTFSESSHSEAGQSLSGSGTPRSQPQQKGAGREGEGEGNGGRSAGDWRAEQQCPSPPLPAPGCRRARCWAQGCQAQRRGV
jgi:hypothetical protein